MPAWRMKPGVGASGSPTQNGSTSALPRPSFTSSRILEAVSALTAARAINGVSNFTGYFRLPGDESSAYCLGPRLRFAVHGPLFRAGSRPAPRVHDRGSGGGHGGGGRGRGHRRCDTVGAVLGPLAAIGLMILLASDIRAVLWVAVVPAILSVVVLVLFVREPPATRTGHANPLSRAALGELTLRYWFVVALGAVFTLARFSEAFLVLRAQDLGMALALVPIVLVVMNLAYSAIAYQAGLAADKGYGNHLLLWGLVALIAADLVIAAFASLAALFAGVVLWGAHMGLTQGLLSALVADAAPAPLRGTAFGVLDRKSVV